MKSDSASTDDRHSLEYFVVAQAPVFDRVLSELRAGTKRTHWMWFIFPQCAGLGSSPHSIRYAIRTRAEATAYLAHPILGPQLREAAAAAMTVSDRSATAIFGSPDDRKLQSCATLFDAIEPHSVFGRLLQHFFNGARDAATVRWLDSSRD